MKKDPKVSEKSTKFDASKLFKYSFRIWIGTCFLFVAGILFYNTLPKKLNGMYDIEQKLFSLYSNIFLGDILIGIGAFLTMIVTGLKRGNKQIKSSEQKNLWVEIKTIKFSWFKPVLIIILIIFVLTIIGQTTGIIKFSGFGEKIKELSTVNEIPLNKQIISQINGERIKIGISPLSDNGLLNTSANNRIEDMISKNYWNTISTDGKDYIYFISNAGFKYSYAGESLVRNLYTAKDIVNALLADKINKENILNKDYKEIGLAIKNGSINGQQSKLIVIHYGSVSLPIATQPKQRTTPKPTIAQTPTPILKPTISGSEVFNLVNAYRRSQSLSGLDVSDELCKFAQTRANFLVADNEKAAKESSTENHIGFRDQVSFDQYSGDYVGENIARIGINSSSYSSSGVVTGWKNSPPHNKLLLRTEENGITSNKGCVATATNQEATVTVLLVGDK